MYALKLWGAIGRRLVGTLRKCPGRRLRGVRLLEHLILSVRIRESDIDSFSSLSELIEISDLK